MKPDQLIDREVVKGILNVTSESQFREMISNGLIPPAIGRRKREHLWSIGLIHDYKKLVDLKGSGFSQDLVIDVFLNSLERLIETGSMTSCEE